MSRLFLIFWVILHVVGFGMSIVHYKMKDNLNNARGIFGWSFGKPPIPKMKDILIASNRKRFSPGST